MKCNASFQPQVCVISKAVSLTATPYHPDPLTVLVHQDFINAEVQVVAEGS